LKPNLILGLGNPLMGDDGIAWHVIERLRIDPRMPADTEVLWGGADLLRNSSHFAGRKRVLVVDAMLEVGEPGRVHLLDHESVAAEGRQNAHHLSALDAIELLRIALPDLRNVQFALAGIAVESARVGEELSPQLSARLPEICARILSACQQISSVAARRNSPG